MSSFRNFVHVVKSLVKSDRVNVVQVDLRGTVYKTE